MPRKRKNERLRYRYFEWIISRLNGVWRADGRSNRINVGRHSLVTRDLEEAKRRLELLDRKMAVKYNLADRSVLNESDEIPMLTLEEGWKEYKRHISRPLELGGLAPSSQWRYESVFTPLLGYASLCKVRFWNQITARFLQDFIAWRKQNGCMFSTLSNDATQIKTMINWLIDENYLPSSCKIKLKVAKPGKSDRYCYTNEQVEAMIQHCQCSSKLTWLHLIVVALSHSGIRIEELVDLKWSDITITDGEWTLVLTDERSHKGAEDDRRTKKNKKGRTLPVHPRLRRLLESLPRSKDGYICRNSRGGRLSHRSARNGLIKHVIKPLVHRFPASPGVPGFVTGRLHSFRHYFISECVNQQIPQLMILNWVGHSSSAILQLYYTQRPRQAAEHMNKLRFGTDKSA